MRPLNRKAPSAEALCGFQQEDSLELCQIRLRIRIPLSNLLAIIIIVSLIVIVSVSRLSPNLWTTIVGKLPNAAAVDGEPAGAGFQEGATENCRVLPESH